MAEEDELQEEEIEALEEAVSSEEGEESAGDGDQGDGDQDMDPLAEEMAKMMLEEEEGEGGGQEDVDRMMEMEMLRAMEEEGGAGGLEEAGGGVEGGGAEQAGGVPPNIARLMDVSLSVIIELGRTEQTLEEVMSLGEQSLIELDKQVGEPVDVLVNGKLFARGEVVTVTESFGVRITELVSSVSEL